MTTLQIHDLRISIEDIWLPDIEVDNQVERKRVMEREYAVVKSTGEVTWAPPYLLTTTCPYDNTMETLDCQIKFGSWVYNGLKINITMVSELCQCTDLADTSSPRVIQMRMSPAIPGTLCGI